MNRTALLATAMACAMFAVGCSGSGNNNNGAQPDVGTTVDMGTPEEDMASNNASTPDMTIPDPVDMRRTPATCGPFPTVFEYAGGDETGAYYIADSSEEVPLDELSIEIYDAPALGPHELGENYETCTYCVLIYAGCDDTSCESTFLATSGTLNITAIGGDGERFVGSLTDVQFEEVTIDDTTYRSTPVAGGELRCIDSHTFDQFIGTSCAAVGDVCEAGASVEEPGFVCVDDGTGTGAGVCQVEMAQVTCVDGPSGGGADFCENTVTCDGVAYKIDCTGTTCTCSVDGVDGAQIMSDSCGYDALRTCGAPIPPVNPVCTDADIADGVGADFCEAQVTCNDVTYLLRCDDGVGCGCTTDGAAGPASTATDCLAAGAALRECGAPLQ